MTFVIGLSQISSFFSTPINTLSTFCVRHPVRVCENRRFLSKVMETSTNIVKSAESFTTRPFLLLVPLLSRNLNRANTMYADGHITVIFVRKKTHAYSDVSTNSEADYKVCTAQSILYLNKIQNY